ncbi:MAG: hypothetical protein ABIY52_10670 [Gemmatimonadaceae bacterium]
MEDANKQASFDASPIESLPEKPVTDRDADSIKGGAIRRVFGGDDDLDDLEVER